MSTEPSSRPEYGFEATYSPLRNEPPRLGQVALLPWDAEIFGFPIGEYRPGPDEELVRKPLVESLDLWASQNRVELIGCRVRAGATRTVALLGQAGFDFVELQIQATISSTETAAIAACRHPARRAEAADAAGIARIAGSSFHFGRYHADPRFPRSLADRRYRAWMERAIARPSPGTWVGVVGPTGRPLGFLHAEIALGLADIRLVALDPENRGVPGRLSGTDLFLGALQALTTLGVTRATARVSASNSAALNAYAAAGFRFHDPEVVLHWHRPDSPHLVRLIDRP